MSSRLKPVLYFAAGVASVGLCSAVYTLYNSNTRRDIIYPSPVDTYLPHLSPSTIAALPYPPTDFIPGARDLKTPYGNIRIYEWGPLDSSRKVLLLHGISGSCVALHDLAQGLAEKGCRVMLIDLFGRGWSGAPANVDYDGRLYASQIFIALASSPVPWTQRKPGGGAFSLVGYSLGGGVATDFTSWFPDLVEDLVLIAPGGLMRTDWMSRARYSGVIPNVFMKRLVRRRLQTMPNLTNLPRDAEIPGIPEEAAAVAAGKGKHTPTEFDIEAIVAFQLDHNVGFVPSFISSIRYAPVREQHERWRLIGKRLDALRLLRQADARNNGSVEPADKEAFDTVTREGLSAGRVIIVLGGKDSIITPAEHIPDAEAALGEENVHFKVYDDAGHDVGMKHGFDIADYVWERWTVGW